MRKYFFTTLLLLAILVFAAVLRITGQNWDDFSHSHPDERFLTALLLPVVGGNNEYTNDDNNFPRQDILVNDDNSHINNWEDLTTLVGARVGASKDSFAANVSQWLTTVEQATAYESTWHAVIALQSNQIDAVLVDAREPTDFAGVMVVDSLDSRELQSLRCRFLYPASDGTGGYFDSRCSPLNPHQSGHGFYVYGTFPLFLAHFASQIVRDAATAGLPLFDWQGGHLVWRGLSALFDFLTIILIFAMGTRLHNRWVGLIAAILYAAAPLAIQKAHYGTTNAIAACMVTAALYLAISVQQRGKLSAYLLFGVACGAAVASRINLAPLAGIIVLAALLQAAPAFDRRLSANERWRIAAYHVLGLILSGIGAFLAFRILNPYAFMGPGILDILPNDRWFDNISSGSFGVSGLQDSPPNWQWLSRASYFYPLKDMLLWAMGPAMAIMAWFGWGWAAYRIVRSRKGALTQILLVVWIGGYFVWMNQIWSMTMRYYLPLYSSLAVLAAWAIVQLVDQARRADGDLPVTRFLLLLLGALFGAIGGYQLLHERVDVTAVTAATIAIVLLLAALLPKMRKGRPTLLGAFVIGFTVIWGVMFSNVYRRQTTLVQGSRYLFERVPGDFAMRIEGSSESVPLINLAINRDGYESLEYEDKLFREVTLYRESEPRTVGFMSATTGSVSSVFAPHLADPLDDPQPERMQIRVYDEDRDELIAEAVLETDLARGEHPLGSAYEIPFNEPLQLEAGKYYRFEVQTGIGSGDVIGSGSVVLTEGDWDNRVTGMQTCELPGNLTLADRPASGLAGINECRGSYAFSKLVNSYDQIMSFPVDNRVKYENILHTLEVGDYLTIASNRFYDTESRNRMRWPLTTLYYEKLFVGELGYDLVAVFDESYELGPLKVSDQYLPIYDSPSWLNEIEADEAFHVYDHPAVFIFRKSPNYSGAKVKALLSSVSLTQVQDMNSLDNGGQLLGTIYWSSKETDQVPTALTFPTADYETQTAGGTWSERFFSDSLANRNQALGVIVWYLTLFVFGAAAFPLVFSLLPNMADGGYGVSKLVGMLIVAWLAWAAATLKLPLWSQAGLVLLLVLFSMFSVLLGYRNRERFIAFLRGHWRRLAWIELLAIIAFLIMIGIRLTNPDLWHPYKGGEKPMDFAYMNGVLRSTTFPPIDPWFAGGFINYYYFGYVLVGAPALLLGIVPAFAYNLMIPTIFSLTGIGAFSGAFNIMSWWKKRSCAGEGSTASGGRRLGNPWTAGILALLMCVLLGNLDTVRVLGMGIANLGGYQRPQGLEQFLVDRYQEEHGDYPDNETRAQLQEQAAQSHLLDNLRFEIDSSASLIGGIIRGAGKVISGEPLSIMHDRWYWGPSRVLTETPGVRGNAITEMPYFTFLYGDLHAHMINMPLILLTLVLVFNEVAQVGREHRKLFERFLALALAGLVVGVMRATNTWDWPSMTLFVSVGLAYCWWLQWRHTIRAGIDIRLYASSIGVLLIAAGVVTVLEARIGPNYDTMARHWPDVLATFRLILFAGIGLIVLWLAIRYVLVRDSAIGLASRLGGFLLLNLAFALPYTTWFATTYTSVRLWEGGKTPLWAYFDIHGLFLFLVVSLLIWDTSHWFRQTKVSSLRGHLLLLQGTGAAVAIVLLLAIALFLAHYQVALIVLPLVIWIAILFFRTNQSIAMRYLLVLIGLALSLTLGVEIVVIGGDIGRQNTVFKFYIQVWLLFSVAGGVALSCLLQSSDQWNRRLRWPWLAACAALFVMAGVFPFVATRARSFDRMAPQLPLTLDGLEYMKEATYMATSPTLNIAIRIDLSVDHKLIRWLQENIEGSPVIMEGRRFPSEYFWNGRMSIATGLPSVLGWNWHQRQQRTFHPLPRWVEQRELNVRTFYDSPDIDIAAAILHHFDVKYVIHSGLEEFHHSSEGLAKFEQMVTDGLLSIAYAVDGGTIYKVNEDGILAYLEERYR